jgi:hypothetical protein
LIFAFGPRSFLRSAVLMQFSGELRLLVGHHGDAVVGDLDLGVLDASLLAGLDLLLLDGARGVGDVDLAAAEALEAVAGAGAVDRDLDVRGLLAEELGSGLGERLDRRGPVDADRALQVLEVLAAAGRGLGRGLPAAAGGRLLVIAAGGDAERQGAAHGGDRQ